MKESIEDRIIERYLNGEMRPDEEREFRQLLELEPELKRRMEAEKIVQKAMEHDLAALDQEEGVSYARFLAALATSVPAAEGVLAQGAAGSSATTGAAGSTAAVTGSAGTLAGGFASAFLTGIVTKGLTTIAIVATLATGVYVATPGDPVETGEPRATVAPAATAVEQTIPGIVDSSAGSPAATRQEEIAAPAEAPAMIEKTEKRTEIEGPAASESMEEGSSREKQSERSRSSMPSEVMAPVEKKENDLDAVLKSMEKDASRQIEVIESDSVETKLKMGTTKKK